jgi:hypothetical protein
VRASDYDALEAELTEYKHGTEVTRSYGDLGAEVAALRARVAELERELAATRFALDERAVVEDPYRSA